jgi:hypothetical protein
MTKIYKGSISSANEISSLILGISEIRYGINADWTFELPAITITTSSSDIAVGDNIIIVQTTDTVKQIMFYVRERLYSYTTRKYTLECNHILEKLAHIKVTEYMDPWGPDWHDAIPSGSSAGTYEYYNSQSVPVQGNIAFLRQYVQVGFLIAQFLYRIGAVSAISDVDINTLNAKDSFYIQGTTPIPYLKLAINQESLRRTGEKTNSAWDSEEFDIQAGVTNCLTYLKHLCSALKICINIFRSDYQLSVIEVSAAPTSSNTLAREDRQIPPYRQYALKRSGLDPSAACLPYDVDWIYYEWTEGAYAVDYTYGIDGADISIIETEDTRVNTAALDNNKIRIEFPINFRLYYININTTPSYWHYSHIQLINYTTPDPDQADYMQWLPEFYAWWFARNTMQTYEVPLTALEMKLPVTQINLETLKLQYERWIQ